jgi:UTP--glucose-1-phosphate uridylyltransferase
VTDDDAAARKAAEQRLRADGSSEQAVAAFLDAFDRLTAGDTGTLPESELEPLTGLPDAADLDGDPGDALSRVLVIKLNGGLGTSMGLTGPKSLLVVKDGHSFLDLTARQIIGLRGRTGVAVPLVLMDSFATRAQSLAALAPHGRLSGDLEPDFLQNRVPKLDAITHAPVDHPAQESLTWAPPGHGDFFPAVAGSGMLAAARSAGYRWAFVSNIDNLGATLDPAILAHVADSGLPFVMEVADRTSADRKGGHLARRVSDGGLVLREVAQTPAADSDAFADIRRHRYFNTNSIWIDLDAIAALLAERGALGLPMIVNHKTVDPGDPGSTPVLQLETAMGAAIGVVPGAAALRVPRSRFLPVKSTNDLLVLRSDAYTLDQAELNLAAGRGSAPEVDLSNPYKLLGDFENRFSFGAPSLVEARSLTVRGDVRWGRDVVVRGSVTVDAAVQGPAIADGSLLEG